MSATQFSLCFSYIFILIDCKRFQKHPSLVLFIFLSIRLSFFFCDNFRLLIQSFCIVNNLFFRAPVDNRISCRSDGIPLIKQRRYLQRAVRQSRAHPTRQFSENICSENDLRSSIFGTFVVKVFRLPVSPRIFEHLKNGIIAYF